MLSKSKPFWMMGDQPKCFKGLSKSIFKIWNRFKAKFTSQVHDRKGSFKNSLKFQFSSMLCQETVLIRLISIISNLNWNGLSTVSILIIGTIEKSHNSTSMIQKNILQKEEWFSNCRNYVVVINRVHTHPRNEWFKDCYIPLKLFKSLFYFTSMVIKENIWFGSFKDVFPCA